MSRQRPPDADARAEPHPTADPDRFAPADASPKSAADIAAIYGDMADTLRRVHRVDRLLTGRYRDRQFGDVSGTVLDVACGTGTNFRSLPEDADLTAIDISSEMVAAARDELAGLALDGRVEVMDAESLAFPDGEFDVVVSALSTCTFPDPVAALREMARVCKPDGEIRLLEHGRTGHRPIDWVLDRRARAHYEAQGCRWNQEPVALVEDAGLSVRSARRGMAGLLRAIDAEPPDGGA